MRMVYATQCEQSKLAKTDSDFLFPKSKEQKYFESLPVGEIKNEAEEASGKKKTKMSIKLEDGSIAHIYF